MADSKMNRKISEIKKWIKDNPSEGVSETVGDQMVQEIKEKMAKTGKKRKDLKRLVKGEKLAEVGKNAELWNNFQQKMKTKRWN